MLVTVLAYVVLGGRRSVLGPLVGATHPHTASRGGAPAGGQPPHRSRRGAHARDHLSAARNRRYAADRAAPADDGRGARPAGSEGGSRWPGLSSSGVSRHFFGVQAVKDLSMAVPPGRITGLIGPNGAGKTTVVNLITGLLEAQRRTHRARRPGHRRAPAAPGRAAGRGAHVSEYPAAEGGERRRQYRGRVPHQRQYVVSGAGAGPSLGAPDPRRPGANACIELLARVRDGRHTPSAWPESSPMGISGGWRSCALSLWSPTSCCSTNPSPA